MTASARKGRGKYKPVILFGNGTTKTLGSRGHTEHWQALTNSGETWRWGRNRAQFENRDDAVAFAQRHIDRLREFKRKADARRSERDRMKARHISLAEKHEED